MKNAHITAVLTIIIMTGTNFLCRGQKATEQFIPIGKSPGVSGKVTVMGNIESLDSTTYSLRIKLSDGSPQTVSILRQGKTIIYIDKSNRGETNSTGNWQDLKPGLLVEVKFSDQNLNQNKKLVEWVKVEARK